MTSYVSVLSTKTKERFINHCGDDRFLGICPAFHVEILCFVNCIALVTLGTIK